MPSFASILSLLVAASVAVSSVNAADHHRSSLEARSVARAAAARRAVDRRSAHAESGVYAGSGIALADTPESVAAGQVKCIRNEDCSGVAVIPGSHALCISGGCRLRCQSNFIPFGGTPPSQCIADNRSCTNVDDPNDTIQCPYVQDGWARCNFHGTVCNPRCLKAWQMISDDGAYFCYDIYHDADNCGRFENACPGDYNGLAGSAPRCIKGKCSLYCPTGTSPVATGSSDYPTACA